MLFFIAEQMFVVLIKFLEMKMYVHACAIEGARASKESETNSEILAKLIHS